MLLNLFLIYIGSVLWVLGMLKLSNHNETFKELSCIHDNNNYQFLVNSCLVPFANLSVGITITIVFLLNVVFKCCKINKGVGKIKQIIEKIVE